jgi:hypothetical protein
MQSRERLRVFRYTTLWGWWKVVGGVFFLAGIYDLIRGEFAPSLPSLQKTVNWWDWKIWFLIALLLLLIATIEGAHRLIKKTRKEAEEKISPVIQAERRQLREKYSDRLDIPVLLLQIYERAKTLAKTAPQIPLTGSQAEAIAGTLSSAGSIPQYIPKLDMATNESSGLKELGKMLDAPLKDGNSIINKLLKMLIDVQASMSLHSTGSLHQTSNDTVYQDYRNRVSLLQCGLPHSINMEIDRYIVSSSAIANMLNLDFTSVSTSNWAGMQLQYLLPSLDSWARYQRDTISTLIERFLLGEDMQ